MRFAPVKRVYDVQLGFDGAANAPAAVRLESSTPLWHHCAIALGGLASIATLWMAYRLSKNSFSTPRRGR